MDCECRAMINLKERSRKWLKEFWPISRPLLDCDQCQNRDLKNNFCIGVASGWMLRAAPRCARTSLSPKSGAGGCPGVGRAGR